MTRLQCDLCGGYLMMDESGEFATCKSCGMRFKRETVKKMIVELNGPIQVEGIANVDNLLTRAGEFELEKNWQKAVEYYNRVLDADPSNSVAKERYTFYTREYTMGEVVTATVVKINEIFHSLYHTSLIVESPNHMSAGIINIIDCLYAEDLNVNSFYDVYDIVGKIIYVGVEIEVSLVKKDLYDSKWLPTDEERYRLHQRFVEISHQEEKKKRLEAKKYMEQQSLLWASQGLCKYCGGNLSIFSSRCKSCGKAN